MTENKDATPSGGEQHDNQQTDQTKTMYQGQCENCGVIDFGNEHPTGEFGPECPGCGAVLRSVVEFDDPDHIRDDAIDADDLALARQTVIVMYGEFEGASPERKSEMVLEQV